MPRYLPEPLPAPGPCPDTGVLLINLGTPDAPTAPALRRYLAEFLSDPRVVELPRLLWWPLLHGIILTTRPRRSAAKYATVWSEEGSPLLAHTRRQAALLQTALAEVGRDVPVEPVMRYGRPGLAAGVQRLKEAGCRRLLALPLYPQYAGATTGSALDGLFSALMARRDVPELRTVRHYPDHPGYIAALAAAVRTHWAEQGRGDRLLMSFHGMPRAAVDQGDPYPEDCRRTATALAAALGLNEGEYLLTYQSRFGKGEWLTPYTDLTLAALPAQGVRRLDVICPGFAADCLETLEEIALEGRDTFLAAGGERYAYIPALNERPEWIAALRDIALANL